jgi:hypothetical protein
MASDSIIGDGLVPSPYELLKRDYLRLSVILEEQRILHENQTALLKSSNNELVRVLSRRIENLETIIKLNNYGHHHARSQ